MPKLRDAVALLVVLLLLTSVRITPLDPNAIEQSPLVPTAEAAIAGNRETATRYPEPREAPAPIETALPAAPLPMLSKTVVKTDSRSTALRTTVRRIELPGSGVVIVIERDENEEEGTASSCPNERLAENRAAQWTRC